MLSADGRGTDREVGSSFVSDVGDDDVADGVEVDGYRLEELIDGVVRSAGAAREIWSELMRRRPLGGSDEDVFDVGPAGEVEDLLFDASRAAEQGWRLLDSAVVAYWAEHDPDDDGGEADSPGG